MNLVPILLALLSLNGSGQGIKMAGIPKVIKEASFCIAYEIRDADKREERFFTPAPDGPFSDSSGEKMSHIPRNILISRDHLDIASLISRTTKHKKLTKNQIASFNEAIFKPKQIYPQMLCHDPHHIFLFYDQLGIPTACLEICFSCNSIKFGDRLLNPPLPKNKSKDSPHEPFEDTSTDQDWHAFNLHGDIVAIAKLCHQLGMGLGKYKSLEEFQKHRKPVKGK